MVTIQEKSIELFLSKWKSTLTGHDEEKLNI
jgi:hypothetical protein